MKIKKIKIPYYKFTVVSVMSQRLNETDAVLKVMKKFRIPQEHIDSVKSEFESGAEGGAEIFYNDPALLILIVNYPHKDAQSLVSTLIHEGRHTADRIISVTGLEGPEAAAYLEQYITTELIKEYIKEETYETH